MRIKDEDVVVQKGDKILTIDCIWYYVHSYDIKTNEYVVLGDTKVHYKELEWKGDNNDAINNTTPDIDINININNGKNDI